MPTIRLTDSAIRKAMQEAKDADTRIELTDVATAGLQLRITRNGVPSWSLKMRDQNGKSRRYTLGDYPALGIADARDQAAATRYRVRHEGADPTAEKRAARQPVEAKPPGMTMLELFDLWSRQTGADAKRSFRDRRNRILSVFEAALDTPAGDLTSEGLQIIADGWPSPSSASAAIRYVRPMLKWAVKRKYVGPGTADLDQTRVGTARERFLSEEELGRLLPYLMENAPTDQAAAVHLMILWTATRLHEAADARWGEFRLGLAIWTVPAVRIKRPRETQPAIDHVLPLPRQAADFLLNRRSETAGPDDLVFGTKNGTVLDNWDRDTRAIQEATGTSGWNRHDLRRTAATWMGRLGTDPHVIEAALNHAAIHSRLAATYNRARYTDEVGLALQRWADEMDRIAVGGEDDRQDLSRGGRLENHDDHRRPFIDHKTG